MPRYIVLVITIIVILAGGIFAYKTWQEKRLVQQSTQNRAATQDETTNWQVYRNDKYGFEMRLPSYWSIDEIRSNRERSRDDVVFNDGRVESHEAISVDKSNKNPEDIVKNLDSYFDPNTVERVSDIKVDNEIGKRIDTTEFGQTFVFINHKGYLYRFTSVGGQMIDKGVLATFRFLE